MPPTDTALWIIVVWLFVVGSAVGSFLNVVVYRLPLGLSLVYPPSHCPACGKRIPWYDNVPIVGWIALRGRCRQCGGSISIRYPLVEAVTALLFALLAGVYLFSSGASLPSRTFEVAENVFVRESGMRQVYCIYLYHLLLLCTLLCAGLIEFDGKKSPPRLFALAIVLGFAAPLVWPALRPVAAYAGEPMRLAGAIDGVAGLAAGALAGGALGWTLCRDHWQSVLWAAVCVGLFLGWQTVVAIVLITAAIQFSLKYARRRLPWMKFSPTLSLGAVALAWILAWASLVSY